MTTPLLEVRDLCVQFETPRGLVTAVDGVSFEVGRASTLGIVGESGCGKSALARTIMGLLNGRGVRRSGQIVFDGVDLATLSQRQLRQFWAKRLAIVFQDPATSLNPVMRIGRQLTEVLQRQLRLKRPVAREAAVELLAAVGISEPARRLQQYPHQLSGGMKQRVGIAIAIACGPQLLIADEPTTALDVTVQAQVLSLLRSLQRDREMSMILISHDLAVVAGRADQVAVMYAGRIVERGAPAAVFGDAQMPYTKLLLESVPTVNSPSHQRLPAIPGLPPLVLAADRERCWFAERCPSAQERCRRREPPVAEKGPDHSYMCWYPVGGARPLESQCEDAS